MRIGRIFGIDIVIHVSWVFVFALVAWSLSSGIGPLNLQSLPVSLRVAIGILTAILFFTSVLIHELAHSVVARSRGIPIKGITLFIFGGVSMFEGEARTAPIEAWVSAVGPLTSIALGVVFYVLARAASAISAGSISTGIAAALLYLAAVNVLLAVFNLLPAFPLDGGRVLHALIWRISGDRLRATRVTVVIGRVFAAGMIVWGILDSLFEGIGGGLWLTLIGWFILQAGNVEGLQAEITAVLRGRKAADVAAIPPATVLADESAAAALRKLLGVEADALPVFVGERFIGMISLNALAALPSEELPKTYVTAVMTRAEDLETIAPGTDAMEALRTLARSKRSALPVIDTDGRFCGFFSRDALVRLIPH